MYVVAIKSQHPYNTGTCDKRSEFGIIVMKNDRGKAIKVNFVLYWHFPCHPDLFSVRDGNECPKYKSVYKQVHQTFKYIGFHFLSVY